MAVDDSYTKVLLHLNGTDGSTTFTDESGKTWTGEADAQLDTAQQKFGTASLLLDGTGDYIHTSAYVADFRWGTGDGAIDCWIRFNALPSSGNKMAMYTYFYDNSNFVGFYIENSGGTYYLTGEIRQDSATPQIKVTGAVTLATNTWYHVEWDRASGEHYLFLDGVSAGTGTETSVNQTTYGSGTTADVGRWGSGSYFNGWIDEFRFTKGVSRHTSGFTPPTSEYAPPSPTATESESATITDSWAVSLSKGMSESAVVTGSVTATATYLPQSVSNSATIVDEWSAKKVGHEIVRRRVPWNITGQHLSLTFSHELLNYPLSLADLWLSLIPYPETWGTSYPWNLVGDHFSLKFRNNVVDEQLRLLDVGLKLVSYDAQ